MKQSPLKALYDNKIGIWVFWIGVARWVGTLFIILGIIIIYFFHVWWAYILAGLMIIVGALASVTAMFVHKKLAPLIDKGRMLVDISESHMMDKAKDYITKKYFNDDDKDH